MGKLDYQWGSGFRVSGVVVSRVMSTRNGGGCISIVTLHTCNPTYNHP